MASIPRPAPSASVVVEHIGPGADLVVPAAQGYVSLGTHASYTAALLGEARRLGYL